jgi:DNA (cytosine-5)-methyltransferase 1
MSSLSVVGLFAGIGGIEEGFSQAGFDIVAANEIDKYAAATYALNHKHLLVVDDIANVNSQDLLPNKQKVTVLTGGFPCQPFSVAGYRKGFEDSRGNVFWEIHRLVQEIDPDVVFLENVKNLESHDQGRTFKTIVQALEGTVGDPNGKHLRRGYHVKSIVLNAKDFGVPQNRERIYIVAFKSKAAFDKFKFPNPQSSKFPSPKLGDFIDFSSKVDKKYYYDESRPFYSDLLAGVAEEGVVYQWRRKYVRANKSGVCPTLTANMGMGGHNVPIIKSRFGIRKLTPAECFSLMGFKNTAFPDGMVDSRLYKQAGNAVVVPVIKAIAEQIRKVI